MASSGHFTAAGYDKKYLIEMTHLTGARLFEHINTDDANSRQTILQKQPNKRKENKNNNVSSSERWFPDLVANEKVCVACKGAFPLIGALSRGINS